MCRLLPAYILEETGTRKQDGSDIFREGWGEKLYGPF